MLTARECVKAWLLDLAWFEAASLGGLKPMQSVAQCVANRVRLGWGDWSSVLSQVHHPGKHAIPTARIADMLLARHYPSLADSRFKRMMIEIDQIYDNTGEKLVGAGVYWADLTWLPGDPRFEELIRDTEEHPRTSQSGTFCTWA